jgi:hypothetical protein
MSQRYNLYFAAYESRIFVYRPRSSPILLTPEPELILATSPDDVDRRIPPSQDYMHPHQSNAMRTGFLGQKEILAIVYDDGAVYAFYIDTIAAYIENTTFDTVKGKSNALPIPEPFFKDNAGYSAWGLAIHQASRLIAVSTNHKEIVVFAFGLSRCGIPPTTVTNVSARYAFRRSRTLRIVLVLDAGADNIPNISFLDNPDGTAQKICGTDIRGTLWIVEIWRPLCGPVRYYPPLNQPGTTGWDVLVLPHTSFVASNCVQNTLGTRDTELRVVNDNIDITAGLATVPDNPAAADHMPVWTLAAPPAAGSAHQQYQNFLLPSPGAAPGVQNSAALPNSNAGNAGNVTPELVLHPDNVIDFNSSPISNFEEWPGSPSSDDEDIWPEAPPHLDGEAPPIGFPSWATLFPPGTSHLPSATLSPGFVSYNPQAGQTFMGQQAYTPTWIQNALSQTAQTPGFSSASQSAHRFRGPPLYPDGLRPILPPRPSLNDEDYFRLFDAYPHDLVYMPHRGTIYGLATKPLERIRFFTAKRSMDHNTCKIPPGSPMDGAMRCSILRSYNNDVELINPVPGLANVICRRPVGLPERPGHPVANRRLNMTLHVPELSLVIIGSVLGRVVLITPTRFKGDTKPFLNRTCRLKYGFRIDHVLPRASEERNNSKLPRRSLLYGIAVAPVPEAPADTAGKGSLLLRRPDSRRKTALGPGTRRYRLVLHFHNHAIVTYDLSRDDDGALQVF